MSRIDIESEEFEEFKLIIKAKCLNEGKSMEETEYILNEFEKSIDGYNKMSDEERIIEELKPVDNLVYRSFVEKYNEEYDSLMEEQKALLSKYITSFTDNGIELKIYLNEEIRRLKEVVVGSTKLEDVRSDKEMFEKTNKVVKTLENFKNQELNKELILSVLKIQNLAREIQS
mgnify:CR=1 FL=1